MRGRMGRRKKRGWMGISRRGGGEGEIKRKQWMDGKEGKGRR